MNESHAERTLTMLCELFDEELERQYNVLAVVERQGKAARTRDIDALQHRGQALALLIQDGLEAERRRLALVGEIVAIYNLPVERQTLSALIDVAPEPWKHRMREFQTRMRGLVQETRALVRANHLVMRRALRRINDTLEVIGMGAPQGAAYDGGGVYAARAAGAAMLDHRG